MWQIPLVVISFIFMCVEEKKKKERAEEQKRVEDEQRIAKRIQWEKDAPKREEAQKQWEKDAPIREAQEVARRIEQIKLDEKDRLWRIRRNKELDRAKANGHDVCYGCLTIDPSRCYCGNCNMCYGGAPSGCTACD